MKLGTLLLLLVMGQGLSGQDKKILMLMSAADTLALDQGEKLRQTGVFLNEFYLAHKAMTQAGYTVVFASPGGRTPAIDRESLEGKYWKNALEVREEALAFIQNDSAFYHPISLEMALEGQGDYIGMIVPGGQGLMVDLLFDGNIPLLLKGFARQRKPTGLICHAPALLLTLPKEVHPYRGRKVNCVTPMEEFVIERFIMKGRPQNRKIAKGLKRMGLKYRRGLPKANFAVRDGNLVSSQNPFSSHAFNKLYLEALEDYLEQK